MDHKEILKSIILDLKEDKRKEYTAIGPIEIKEEITVQEPQIIDFNAEIDSLETFLSSARILGEDKRHERVFNRVFDKHRDLNTINGYGWDVTLNWLNKNLYAQPKNSMRYLITVYRTVEILYLRNRASEVDPWMNERFKEFEKWVFNSLDYLFFEKQSLKNKSKLNAPINKNISVSLSDEYILGLNVEKINKSYNYFNNLLFENISFRDYLDCFNTAIDAQPIKFKYKGQIKFVYFLTRINSNEKIAFERFGIKSFKTQKRRALNENKPDLVFINRIESILK